MARSHKLLKFQMVSAYAAVSYSVNCDLRSKIKIFFTNYRQGREKGKEGCMNFAVFFLLTYFNNFAGYPAEYNLNKKSQSTPELRKQAL